MENRIIKFRALKDDMSNCNFVYGELVYDAIGIPSITHKDFSRNGLFFNSCLKGTEGQFTGLHDKNGKEIYEGDITENPKGKRGLVMFDDGSFTIRALDNHNTFFILTSGFCLNKSVIGNIHENPELLTTK